MTTPVEASPAVRLTNVRAGYGDAVVFDGTSCCFSRARTTAIIGPGGSGKSTLLKLVRGAPRETEGLWSSGEITISPERGDDSIEYVGQRQPRRGESLRERLAAAGSEAPARALDEVWRDVDPQVGARLLARLEAPYQSLSQETHQLAALTVALARRPALLLLDEPASSLRPPAADAVRELLKRSRGARTVLVVSHNLEFARAVADDVMFVLDGVIVETGTARDVFENPAHERTREMITWGS